MKNRQKGVALIELAITLPLLLAIFFAVTEFGRAIYTYNTLAKATRDASRYLTTKTAGDTSAWETARNLVVYGTPSAGTTPLVPALAASMVAICDASIAACESNKNQGGNPLINTVTVAVTGYQFTPIMDLLAFTRFYTEGNSGITSITFGDISVTMRQSYE